MIFLHYQQHFRNNHPRDKSKGNLFDSTIVKGVHILKHFTVDMVIINIDSNFITLLGNREIERYQQHIFHPRKCKDFLIQ